MQISYLNRFSPLGTSQECGWPCCKGDCCTLENKKFTENKKDKTECKTK